MTSTRVWLVDRGGALGVATLGLYVWLAPSYIVGGDSAEFSTLGALGGIPHPSGYPLYLLWLRATAWLPGATPAHTAAIATAILGAAAVVVLHAACRAWGARPAAATIAVMLFATGPIVLRLHTEAEVFALNDVVVAIVLWLAAARGPLRGVARAAVLGLVAGLGLSDHLTCVLVAPIGVLGVVRGCREAGGTRAGLAAALAALGLVLGLLPYLALCAQPTGGLSWGRADTIGDLVARFLRRDYGGPTNLTATGAGTAGAALGDQLGALAITLGRVWRWLPAALGVAMLGVRAARRAGTAPATHDTRVGWLLLAISWLACGPIFVAQFNLETFGLGGSIVQRFHLLPALVLAIPIASGLDAAAAWWARDPRRPQLRAPALRIAIAAAAFVALAATALPGVRRTHSPAVADGVANLLRSLPPGAIVITTPDDLHFGLGYAQLVEHARPDVVAIDWPLMRFDWYVAALARRGVGFDHHDAVDHGVRVASQLLASGRPLFVDAFATDILAAFPNYAFGLVSRVLPAGSAPPSLDDILAQNQRLYTQVYRFAYVRPGRDDDWATEMHQRYAAAWYRIGEMLKAAGRDDDAAHAFGVGNQIGPQP